TPTGTIQFVTFPGYEWAPDARCWQSSTLNPFPIDSNAFNNTPGHINYFFDRTTGWSYHDDVWEPGDGDSDFCAAATAAGITYYSGSKDWVDELLGQLIHQRDDPGRGYDLLIQYNHPASSIDKGGSSDYLAKWFEFEHSHDDCSVAEGGVPCRQNQCEAVRRAYALNSVEWYTKQEASIGARVEHAAEGAPECSIIVPEASICYHDAYHMPDKYVTSRGLREGYQLASTGGSDSHGGRKFHPTGFPGDRGAGSKSLTVVYADGSTREQIWDGLTRRHTYALSRFNETGPVHKGRVDFYSLDPLTFNTPRIEHDMGDHVEATSVGTPRAFTIHAAAEAGTSGVYPIELRLYRVGPDTPLTQATTPGFFWLDDIPGDPGKFGELLGTYVNPDGSPEIEHSWSVVVHPGDAVFAVVPYSDYVWVDDYFATDQTPLDADRDGVRDQVDTDGDGIPDTDKRGFLHNNNNTWARTTPIFFEARKESARTTSVCATVTFNASGSQAPEDAVGGLDGDLGGDTGVLPVAIPGGYDVEWNRYRFTTLNDSQYVDLSFYTGSDDHDPGTLFAVRIDGRLVLSGRGTIDWANDTLVGKRDIPFALKSGIHTVEIHSDDQEYANGDNDPDFHCNDHDGVPAFLDALSFHNAPGAPCGDHTPPTITCPAAITLECNTFGGVSASDARIVAFLGGAVAVDHVDNAPDTHPGITTDAPEFFPTGTTTVTFTAGDAAGNAASCTADVVIADTTPPQLAAFRLAPAEIGPPRHDLKSITVPTLLASDVCDAAPAIRCSVTSDEAPNGLGDGDTPADIVFNGVAFTTQGTGEQLLASAGGQGTFALQLRAERSAAGLGRTYTVSCAGVDAGSNQGTAKTSTVFVPKCAQGKGRVSPVCSGAGKDSVRRGGVGGTGIGVIQK
ncbi:MAG TPA: HYR domain-containing protein, partial [Candidatus Polarisedimenticolia bacterium]|nr:HYR domain-containing protein [Candidatus Polarisedimenticolia bacterium]